MRIIQPFQQKLGNRWIQYILRFAFIGIIFTFLSTRVNFVETIDTIFDVSLIWLPALILLFLVVRYIWAIQMTVGLERLRIKATTTRLFEIILVSTFYNLILPGALVGGVVTWFKLSHQGSKADAAALLIYLRMVNTLTLLVIGFVGIWFDPNYSSFTLRSLVVGAFIFLLLILIMLLSQTIFSRLEGAIKWCLQVLPIPIQNKVLSVLSAVATFRDLPLRTVGYIVGLSLASHLVGIVLWVFASKALGLNVSVLVIGWLRSLISILDFLPLTIAGLGVREASLLVLLGKYGVPGTQALSYSLTIFALTVIGSAIGGLIEIRDVVHPRFAKS